MRTNDARVLYLIDTLGLGGAQRLLKNIFESQRENTKIFLYALRRTGLAYEVHHPNVFVYPSSMKYSLAPIGDILRFVAKQNIDTLYCHLPRSIAFGLIIKRLCRRNIRLIVQDHAESLGHNPFFDAVMALAGREATAVVASSLANKTVLCRLLGRHGHKVRVMYSCTAPALFNVSQMLRYRDGARAELGIGGDEFVAGFAGRIEARKGWRIFAEAAAIMKCEPMRFLIAGDGSGKRELLRFIDTGGLGNRIIFLGHVANMARYYAALDCFVLPSQWEGMPMTLLEAMSMGIPVICSRAPGIEEFVSDGNDALLIDPNRPEDLARKLSRLAGDKLLRQEIALQATKTVERYGVDCLNEELCSILRNVSES